MLATLVDAEIKVQETMGGLIPDFLKSDEDIKAMNKSIENLKKRAEELRKPFAEVGLGIEETGKKAKVVFKNINVDIDQTRVREDTFTFALLKQLEAIDEILEKNKERKKVSTESSKASETALAKEKKQALLLKEALEGVGQAFNTALNFETKMDTGLFSNFSKGFKEVADSQKQMFTQMRDMGATTFDKLKTSLTDFVMTGKLSFKDLGTFVIRSMVDMLIGQAIKSALNNSVAMFKASSIKKAMISLFEGAMKTFASIPFPFNIAVVGGALAFGTGIVNKIRGFERGGRPPVGQPSIVGEKGAELFVPDQAGTVVPNDKLGMNKNVTVNFNINTVDARGFNELLVNSRGVIINLINSAMNEKGRMAVI